MADYEGRTIPKSEVDAYLQGREVFVREAYNLIVLTLQLIAEGLYPPEEYQAQLEQLPSSVQDELEEPVFTGGFSLLAVARSQTSPSRPKAA